MLRTWKKGLLKYPLTKYRYFGDLSLFGPFLHNMVSFFPTFGKRLSSYTTTMYSVSNVCVGSYQLLLELTLSFQFLNSTPSHLYKYSIGNTTHSVHPVTLLCSFPCALNNCDFQTFFIPPAFFPLPPPKTQSWCSPSFGARFYLW